MTTSGIEICMDNGKRHVFDVMDNVTPNGFLEDVKSLRVFSRPVLMLASNQYLVHIQTKDIEMIRCHQPQQSGGERPADKEDILEIGRDSLVEKYLQLPESDRHSSRNTKPGEFMTTFLEIHTEGGREVFLQLYIQKKDTREGREFISHLFEQPGLIFRLPAGGFGVLRPARIITQYTYPGPSPDVLLPNTYVVE